MNPLLDHVLVTALILGALAFFAARFFRRGKGCGAGCGCAPKNGGTDGTRTRNNPELYHEATATILWTRQDNKSPLAANQLTRATGKSEKLPSATFPFG